MASDPAGAGRDSLSESEWGFDPLTIILPFGLYALWLVFLSWLIGKMIERGKPPLRAAACVAASVIVAWAPKLPSLVFHFSEALPDSIGWPDLIVHISAPLAVFFGQWWWFHTHRIDREDIAKVFE